MRTLTNIDFSIIIPTRERSQLLERCVESVYNKAVNPSFIEIILVLDYDDPTLPTILSFINNYKFKQHIRCIIKYKSDFVVRDCNNAAAQLSTGKYIWILNDDAEIITDSYDNILIRHINKFLKDKKDRLLYVMVNDDIHVRLEDEIVYRYGTCFPIISREVLDCLNFLMPDTINAWGGDTELWRIISKLKESRVLDLIDKIRLKCETIHNESIELEKADNTQSRMEHISQCRSINDEELQQYINKLNGLIL